MNIKKIIFLALALCIAQPVKAADDATAWIIGLCAGIGGIFVGGIGVATYIESCQAAQLEKEEQEKNNQQKKAQEWLASLFIKDYQREYESLEKTGEISAKVIECASLPHANDTPYYHYHYGQKLRADLEKIDSVKEHLCDDDKQRAVKAKEFLNMLREKNALYYKKEIAFEFEQKQIAETEQQKRQFQIAAKKAKYEKEEREKNVAIKKEQLMQELREQARLNQTLFLAEFAKIEQRIIESIDGHGIRGLQSQVIELRNQIEQLCDQQETILSVGTQSNQSINELKNTLQKIMQRLDTNEIASAQHTAEIDDLKKAIRNLIALLTAPSAPMLPN